MAARAAAEQAGWCDAEAVAVGGESDAVLENTVALLEAEAAPVFALAAGIRDQGVVLNPKERVVELHRFHRDVGAVGKRAVDPIDAVAVSAAAIPATEDFKIDIVFTVAEFAEAGRRRRVVTGRDDAFRHDFRKRHHHRVEDAVARQQACADRRRRRRVEDAAEGGRHLDRPGTAIVDRHVRVRQHRLEAGDGGGFGRRARVVHVGFDLRVGAGEIDLDPIALDRQFGFDTDRRLTDPVIIDHRLAVVLTIRHGANRAADTALRIVQHFHHGRVDHVHAELATELADALRTDRIRGELRVQITDGRLRHSHIGGDKAFQPATVPIAGQAVLCRREDETFLMDVAGLRIQARRTAAKIDVVHHRGAETDQFVLKEDRRKNEDIRQMLTAVEGVVVDEEIVGLYLVEIVELETRPKSVRD